LKQTKEKLPLLGLECLSCW